MATPGKDARLARPSNTPAILSSRDNRWLKTFRMALRGGLPTESGCVGVEGVRLVEEALRSGCRIEAVLFSETGERHHERLAPLIDRPEIAFPLLRTTDRLFEGLADTEHPQGVAALVQPRPTSFDDLLRPPPSRCPAPPCGPRGRASPRQRRHDYPPRRCLRRPRCGNVRLRPIRHRQPLLAKSFARFGRSGASSAPSPRNVAPDFAHAIAHRQRAYAGDQRPRERGTSLCRGAARCAPSRQSC